MLGFTSYTESLNRMLLTSLGFIAALLVLRLLYLTWLGIYNVFFSPLRKFPGPFLCAATQSMHDYWMMKGVLAYRTAELHRRYGPVVRIKPHQLSFIDPEAWKDSHGFLPGKRQLTKDDRHYGRLDPDFPALAGNIPNDDHARQRRNFSHGFSDKSLREQESIITVYFDLLMKRLHERTDKPIDMCYWYNCTTFDVIGDLTFGESFRSLETGDLHWFVRAIFDGVHTAMMLRIIQHYSWALKMMIYLSVPKQVRINFGRMKVFAAKQVEQRLDLEKTRPDFMTGVINNQNTNIGMSRKEIDATAVILITAGSETTSTTLSTATWLLASDPARMAKAVSEVRNAFAKESDITMTSVGALSYMIAVLSEALRILPPVSGSTARNTDPEGNVIAGRFIPGNTAVGVPQWASAHSPVNFRDPDDFVPERWLGDPRYENDRRSVSMPFSIGPRNCIGQNLALAEMRTIFARMLWNFDIELCEESKNWMKGMKMYSLWERPKLMVKLNAVKRS